MLAADYKYNSSLELEGDLEALKFVDLEREGLAEYKTYLQKLGITYGSQPAYSSEAFTPANNSVALSSGSFETNNNSSQYDNSSNYQSNYGSSAGVPESSYY